MIIQTYYYFSALTYKLNKLVGDVACDLYTIGV